MVSLKYVQSLSDNECCADCGSTAPNWSSINLGIFLCLNCSGHHRNLGVHISQVRSVSLDEWKQSWINKMLHIGNKVSNMYYEACLPISYTRPNSFNDSKAMEDFIRKKYELKLWISRTLPNPSDCYDSQEDVRKAFGLESILEDQIDDFSAWTTPFPGAPSSKPRGTVSKTSQLDSPDKPSSDWTKKSVKKKGKSNNFANPAFDLSNTAAVAEAFSSIPIETASPLDHNLFDAFSAGNGKSNNFANQDLISTSPVRTGATDSSSFNAVASADPFSAQTQVLNAKNNKNPLIKLQKDSNDDPFSQMFNSEETKNIQPAGNAIFFDDFPSSNPHRNQSLKNSSTPFVETKNNISLTATSTQDIDLNQEDKTNKKWYGNGLMQSVLKTIHNLNIVSHKNDKKTSDEQDAHLFLLPEKDANGGEQTNTLGILDPMLLSYLTKLADETDSQLGQSVNNDAGALQSGISEGAVVSARALAAKFSIMQMYNNNINNSTNNDATNYLEKKEIVEIQPDGLNISKGSFSFADAVGGAKGYVNDDWD